MSDEGRYAPTGRRLSDREREILTILVEEASEVIHAASKILRFGVDDGAAGHGPNRRVLGLELGDLEAMVALARGDGLVDPADVREGRLRKIARVRKYSRHLP